jgi:hypothetical protein
MTSKKTEIIQIKHEDVTDECKQELIKGLTSHSVGKYKPAVETKKSAPLHFDPYEIKEINIQTTTFLTTFFVIVPDGKQGISWTIIAITDTYADIKIQNELNIPRDVTIYWQ